MPRPMEWIRGRMAGRHISVLKAVAFASVTLCGLFFIAGLVNVMRWQSQVSNRDPETFDGSYDTRACLVNNASHEQTTGGYSFVKFDVTYYPARLPPGDDSTDVTLPPENTPMGAPVNATAYLFGNEYARVRTRRVWAIKNEAPIGELTTCWRNKVGDHVYSIVRPPNVYPFTLTLAVICLSFSAVFFGCSVGAFVVFRADILEAAAAAVQRTTRTTEKKKLRMNPDQIDMLMDMCVQRTVTQPANARSASVSDVEALTEASCATFVCSVCLEASDGPNTELAMLPCGHDFHASCLKAWMKRGHTCPLCGADLCDMISGNS